MLYTLLIALSLLVQRRSDANANEVDPLCGVECLYVVLGALEQPQGDFLDLKKEFGKPSKSGYSMEQIYNVASKRGLYVAWYPLEELSQKELMPKDCFALIHHKQQHFRIVSEIRGKTIITFDTRLGRGVVSKKELLRDYSNTALVIAKESPKWKKGRFSYLLFFGISGLSLCVAWFLIGLVRK